MKYLVSHDCMDAVPISLDNLLEMAFSPQTSDRYTDYLQFVVNTAKKVVASVGQTINDVEFSIHENGCIHPFGMGGHAYSKNFYTRIDENELPPFSEHMGKVR